MDSVLPPLFSWRCGTHPAPRERAKSQLSVTGHWRELIEKSKIGAPNLCIVFMTRRRLHEIEFFSP